MQTYEVTVFYQTPEGFQNQATLTYAEGRKAAEKISNAVCEAMALMFQDVEKTPFVGTGIHLVTSIRGEES